jgi:putative tricarboxylic transport membrane protein
MNGHSRPRVDATGLAIAAVLFITAGVILWDMATLQISSVYGVGPKAMPIVVAVGLGILALGNGFMAFKGDLPERETMDPRAILLILGGMAALIALIGFGGGFIPATAILFATTSAAFGRRAFLVDLAIGFGLGLIIYLLFAKLLSLTLPMGPIENLF